MFRLAVPYLRAAASGGLLVGTTVVAIHLFRPTPAPVHDQGPRLVRNITLRASERRTERAWPPRHAIGPGFVLFRMVNDGSMLYEARLVRISPERTAEELVERLSHEGGVAWAEFLGGPGAVAPGDSSEITMLLTPGRYVFLSYFTPPEGGPRIAPNPVREFEVIGASRSLRAPVPRPVMHQAATRDSTVRPSAGGQA